MSIMGIKGKILKSNRRDFLEILERIIRKNLSIIGTGLWDNIIVQTANPAV